MFSLYDKEGNEVKVKTITDKKEYLASGYYFEKDPTNEKYLKSPQGCSYVNENFKERMSQKSEPEELAIKEEPIKKTIRKRKGF